MKNTIRKIKNMKYTKLVIGIIIGVIIAGTSVYYAATIYYDSVNVGYDNTVSGLDADNVQDALDELCDLPNLNERVGSLESGVSSLGTRVGNLENTYANNLTSGVWLFAHGNTALVKIDGRNPGNISVRTTVATVPAGYRPPTEVVAGDDTGCRVGVRSNGEVWFDPSCKNKPSYISIAYPRWY